MSGKVIVEHLLAGSLREKICRICLSEEDILQPLSTYIGIDDVTVRDVLLSFTSIEILEEDSLPAGVCSPCLQAVMSAYELKQKCEQADATIRQCISCLYREVLSLSQEPGGRDTILIVLPGAEEPPELLPVKCENDTPLPADLCNLEPYSGLENDEIFSDNKDIIQLLLGDDLKMEDIEPSEDFPVEQITKKIIVEKPTRKQRTHNECTMCFEVFPTWDALKAHEKTHPENSRHYCKICYRSYRKASILKRHIITHTGNKGFVCNACGKSFYYRNALKAHMRYHQEKKFRCQLCPGRFYFRHLLVEHVNSDHPAHATDYDYENNLPYIKEPFNKDNEIVNIKQEYDCTMCMNTFKTQDDLNEHKLQHPEGSRHICRVCGRSYLEAGTLKRHTVTHTGKKSYLCTVCGKAFFYRNVLKAHMVYHGEKTNACELCDKTFHTRHMLREHERLTHSRDKYSFMCELCGKLCSSKTRLLIHRDSHNKICCPTCGKSYKNLRYFKEHLKKHNGKVEPKKCFECDYCGQQRSLKTLLELHILSKHLKERRYRCTQCDKAFFSKGSLNEHGVVHTRARPAECNVCGRRLVNKKALVLHNRLHTGERPYACALCGERFLSSSRRLVHLKSRHGERTESCRLCPARFHLRSDLNKHMLVHLRGPRRPRKEVVDVPLFTLQEIGVSSSG